MTPKTLDQLFDLNYRVLGRNTAGVDHQRSLAAPQPAGNCLNWVVGHILVSRSQMLQLLGRPPLWSDADAAPYRRGSQPLGPGAAAQPFESLLADFERSQQAIRAAVDGLGEGALAARAPAGSPGGETVGESLAFFHFHEAYHVGQTGILRRLTGLPGAIP